jgi:CRISPR/Cas system-associated endonuclease Cas3-HD
VNSCLVELDDDIYQFDIEKALETYQNRFILLHYHELWCSVVNDSRDAECTTQECTTNIEVQQIKKLTTLDKTEKTAVLVGTYRATLG